MKMADSRRLRAGGRWSFCALRAALRASIHARLGELFGNLAQKLGRTLFRFRRNLFLYKTLHAREFLVNSLSKVFEVLNALIRANSSSMRLPNSSNLSISDKSSEKSPCREEARRLGYYRNAVCGSQGGELALPYRWQWRVEKWKNAMRGLFGGGEQQPRPKICPACGALVGINTTRCHECGASLRFSLAALSKNFPDSSASRKRP